MKINSITSKMEEVLLYEFNCNKKLTELSELELQLLLRICKIYIHTGIDKPCFLKVSK